MKPLFTSPDIKSIELVQTVLEEAGIRHDLQNETIPIPTTIFQPEVWVIDDADFPTACELRDSIINSTPVVLSAWTCPDCSERLEGQFGSCWKCGAKRPEAI